MQLIQYYIFCYINMSYAVVIVENTLFLLQIVS